MADRWLLRHNRLHYGHYFQREDRCGPVLRRQRKPPAFAHRSPGERHSRAARPLDARPGGRDRAWTRRPRPRVVPASRGRGGAGECRQLAVPQRRPRRLPAAGISRHAGRAERCGGALRRGPGRRAIRPATCRPAAPAQDRGLDARARARLRARRAKTHLPRHAQALRHQGDQGRDDPLPAGHGMPQPPSRRRRAFHGRPRGRRHRMGERAAVSREYGRSDLVREPRAPLPEKRPLGGNAVRRVLRSGRMHHGLGPGRAGLHMAADRQGHTRPHARARDRQAQLA